MKKTPVNLKVLTLANFEHDFLRNLKIAHGSLLTRRASYQEVKEDTKISSLVGVIFKIVVIWGHEYKFLNFPHAWKPMAHPRVADLEAYSNLFENNGNHVEYIL